jgi:hypothetical protein
MAHTSDTHYRDFGWGDGLEESKREEGQEIMHPNRNRRSRREGWHSRSSNTEAGAGVHGDVDGDDGWDSEDEMEEGEGGLHWVDVVPYSAEIMLMLCEYKIGF